MKKRKEQLNKQQIGVPAIRSEAEIIQRVVQSPSPLQALHQAMSVTEEGRIAFGKQVQPMIHAGAAKPEELQYILQQYPEHIQTWVESSQNLQVVLSEFSDSPFHQGKALAMLGQISYDIVYRALRKFPIRPHLGDTTRRIPQGAYWEQDQPVIPDTKTPSPLANLNELRRSYHIEKGFQTFSLDPNGYLQSLELRMASEPDQNLARILQDVYVHYQIVRDITFPALHTLIAGPTGELRKDRAGNIISFPSTHQKAAIVEAAQKKSVAVFDGTGSGKTGIGIGLAEHIEAKRILVICPASMKETWEKRIREYYEEAPSISRVDSKDRIAVAGDSRYTIVNYDLLIERDTQNGRRDTQELSRLEALMEGNYDLLILDEAHAINNPNKRSDSVVELAQKVDRKLILTATPIRNSVDDIKKIAQVLASNESLEDVLATRVIRRKTEDLVELPPFCPENNGEVLFNKIALNPTQQAVYNMIFDDASLDPLRKLSLLRFAAIDHNLVTGRGYQLLFDNKRAIRDLHRAYATWQTQQAKGNDILFNSDFLVTHGFAQLFLSTHMQYRQGMDQLIKAYGGKELQAAWKGVVESAKLTRIKELIKEKIAKGEKVVIFSGHFTEGIMKPRVGASEEDMEIMEDFYTSLQREFSDFDIERIYGEISPSARKGQVSDREKARLRFQNDPNCKVLLTSVPSSSLGIDFTVNDGRTTGVSILGIDLPYTYADFWQMISRVYRFGQTTPVNVQILEAIDTIDKGVRELIYNKKEIADYILDGATPTEEQRELFENDRQKTAKALEKYITSPKKLLNNIMRGMRGKGAKENTTYLEKESTSEAGKTWGEIMAELYERYWEYTYSGHTARLLQQLIDGLREGREALFHTFADMGSGPLILQRTMMQESELGDKPRIVNIDINGHMLQKGVALLEQQGYLVDKKDVRKRQMSNTGIEGHSVDSVVCSLALHYSNSAEDRGKILAEANRILRYNGYYFITLPDSYLTDTYYKSFVTALKKFGFEVDTNLSGRVEAVDFTEAPFTTWLIAARKIGKPLQENLSMDEFAFAFEIRESHYSEKNGNGKAPKEEIKERLVRHEQFEIYDPQDSFNSKGSPQEVFSRMEFDAEGEPIIHDEAWYRMQERNKHREAKRRSKRGI